MTPAYVACVFRAFDDNVPHLPRLASHNDALRMCVEHAEAKDVDAAYVDLLLQQLYRQSCSLFSLYNTIRDAVLVAHLDRTVSFVGRMPAAQAAHMQRVVRALMDDVERHIGAVLEVEKQLVLVAGE